MKEKYSRVIEAIKLSPVKIAIVRLFKSSPHIMDTLRGVASWAFVPVERAAQEVDELVSLGVLSKYGDGPGAVYRYTTDENIRKCVDCNWDEIEQARAEMQRRGL